MDVFQFKSSLNFARAELSEANIKEIGPEINLDEEKHLLDLLSLETNDILEFIAEIDRLTKDLLSKMRSKNVNSKLQPVNSIEDFKESVVRISNDEINSDFQNIILSLSINYETLLRGLHNLIDGDKLIKKFIHDSEDLENGLKKLNDKIPKFDFQFNQQALTSYKKFENEAKSFLDILKKQIQARSNDITRRINGEKQDQSIIELIKGMYTALNSRFNETINTLRGLVKSETLSRRNLFMIGDSERFLYGMNGVLERYDYTISSLTSDKNIGINNVNLQEIKKLNNDLGAHFNEHNIDKREAIDDIKRHRETLNNELQSFRNLDHNTMQIISSLFSGIAADEVVKQEHSRGSQK